MDPVERSGRVRDSSSEPRVVPFRRAEVVAGHADASRAVAEAPTALSIGAIRPSKLVSNLVQAIRPTQWIKNGVVFAGLVFGGMLLDPMALGRATLAATLFCLLSGGFYLVNDVRDIEADRLHPLKRLRPIAAGTLSPKVAIRFGALFIATAIAGSLLLGGGFVLFVLAYALLMAAYNLGLKHIVILDVFAISAGFVIRAAAGAIVVGVVISPWLLTCTMLLALLIGFGKRRNELASLYDAARHRRNLETYSLSMLDQSVAVTAAGTLLAYAVYTFEAESAPPNHLMMLTIPVVSFAIFRYLYLLYHRGEGGTPEAMLIADRGLCMAVTLWALASALLFNFSF